MRTLFHFYKNRPEWMNEFCNSMRDIIAENRLLISYLAVFGFLIFCVFVVKHGNSSESIALQNKRSEIIQKELNEIKSILQEVESNPYNSKQQQQALQNLENDILNTQKTMTDVAKSADIQKVYLEVASVKDDMDLQIMDVKKAISESAAGKEYLDASVLPFHVISVDVIAGQPFVSVEYASHVSPLSVGDELAGWRVVSADYESAASEFINDKNQHIKVSLQGA